MRIANVAAVVPTPPTANTPWTKRVSGTAARYLRFNVAQCGNKRVFDVLAKVMRI
jgi:hypothetical protein